MKGNSVNLQLQIWLSNHCLAASDESLPAPSALEAKAETSFLVDTDQIALTLSSMLLSFLRLLVRAKKENCLALLIRPTARLSGARSWCQLSQKSPCFLINGWLQKYVQHHFSFFFNGHGSFKLLCYHQLKNLPSGLQLHRMDIYPMFLGLVSSNCCHRAYVCSMHLFGETIALNGPCHPIIICMPKKFFNYAKHDKNN